MKRDPIPAHVLATRLIPNVSPDLAKELNLAPDQKSLALISADCDDVTYTALDEATKKADCKVVYAKSMYAGAANANTLLAGEIIVGAAVTFVVDPDTDQLRILPNLKNFGGNANGIAYPRDLGFMKA